MGSPEDDLSSAAGRITITAPLHIGQVPLPGEGGVAIGRNGVAQQNGIAIGTNANAAKDALAIGHGAFAHEEGSLVFAAHGKEVLRITAAGLIYIFDELIPAHDAHIVGALREFIRLSIPLESLNTSSNPATRLAAIRKLLYNGDLHADTDVSVEP